jgi:Lrp/AsnC family leucine-responsive transcriptional regulator
VDDDIDRLIVSKLAADGRASLADISRETGLSTSALHQRVKRLESRGTILGYHARLNREDLGLPLTAFVSLTPLNPAETDEIPERIADIAEIESCWSVAGSESYILKVNVSTPGALEILLGKIRNIAHVSTRTTVVLSTPFEDRAPAIAAQSAAN